MRNALAILATLILAACAERPSPATTGPEAMSPCKPQPPSEPMACTMEWRPVCGCDGVTYSNACSARAAGIPRFRDGACEADRPE